MNSQNFEKKVVKIVFGVISFSVFLLIILFFAWSQKYRNYKFSNVTSDMIQSIEVESPLFVIEKSVFWEGVVIVDKNEVNRIIGLMKYNEKTSVNHPIDIWRAHVKFQFMNDSDLLLRVLKTKNQGCLIIFSPDNFGFKTTVRNDSLCACIESIAKIKQ